MKLPRLVLYFRSRCASCEEARRILERVRPHHPFDLEEMDVEEDAVACALHGDKTPVLSIQGQVAFRHSLDEDRLVRRLRQAADALAFEEEQERRRREGRLQA